MSLAEPAPQDRRPSPGLTFNFSSNNPFRNRAVSPASATLPSPPIPSHDINTERPVSRNPFLDATESLPPPPVSGSTKPAMNGRTSPIKPSLTGNAAELFENLSLNGNGQKQSPPRSQTENVPPRPMYRPAPPPGHRGRGSREEEHKPKREGKPKGLPQLDIFADPPELGKQNGVVRVHPRRNSESSVVDRSSKHLNPEEARRRDRRHHDSKHPDRRSGTSKSRKPNRRLDIIDKLDVTSIYGTGLFHHDGPFDACNPHRNRKGARQPAPMQAFPKDSLNNALGGSGPVNSNINLNQFHGRGAEGFEDYGNSGRDPYGPRARPPPPVDRSLSFDPLSRIEPIHGDESMGLGTSTFLEGAPASRIAMQRRESEAEAQMSQGGGLSRKKSLAQKIRGISNARPVGRTISPENALERTVSPSSPMSAGSTRKLNERNPFFQDYDAAYDQKGAKIAAAEDTRIDSNAENSNVARVRAASSPRRGLPLQRRGTNEGSINEEEGSSKTSGFLNRVKSMKGGRRPRPIPERKDTAP